MHIITLFFLLIMSQTTPEQVVQEQLDTYNARDIEGFMSVMSQDVALYELHQSDPSASGHEAVKRLYTELFAKSPNLHSILLNRVVMGNKIIDHESITGRLGNDQVVELAVIYEVNAQMKISKITVIRK
jgi:hypothetical protein